MTRRPLRGTTLLNISISCSSADRGIRKGAAYDGKSLREGCQDWRTENPAQDAPHKLEDVLESQERGKYARMQIFIFSWLSTFTLETHSLNTLMSIQTLQILRCPGDTNNCSRWEEF